MQIWIGVANCETILPHQSTSNRTQWKITPWCTTSYFCTSNFQEQCAVSTAKLSISAKGDMFYHTVWDTLKSCSKKSSYQIQLNSTIILLFCPSLWVKLNNTSALDIPTSILINSLCIDLCKGQSCPVSN